MNRVPREELLAEVALEVFETFPEGVLVLDHDLRKRYVNPMAAHLLDTPVEEMLGQDYHDIHPESEWGPFEQAFLRVLDNGVPEVVDAWYPAYGKHFRASIVPCTLGITVCFTDVTAARRQHERLLDDLRVLQQVVDHADVGIVLKDLEGRYLLVNEAAARPTGVAPGDALGRKAGDFYPPHIAEALRGYELEVLRTGTAIQREETVEYEPGTPRTFLSVTFPAYDEEGQLVATGAVHTDVTARKEAEAGLAASEQRYRDIFRGTSLGQLVMTPEGRVVEANDALCAMLGYQREELVGASAACFIAVISPWEERRRRMLESGGTGYEVAEDLVRKDGSLMPSLGTVNVIGDPRGTSPLVSVIVRDQSQMRALQERLVGAERMEAVGELAAGISHDVNNVLAAVSGYAQLLNGRIEDPELLRHLNGIFRSVDRAADLVAQLLAFASQQHLEPTDVEPCDVVDDLEDMLRRLLPPGIELVVDCPRIGLVRADGPQLQQVLLNLVLNARDAMPDGGQIRMRVDRHASPDDMDHLPAGAYGRVTVADDGVGMPPEVASRCFEPFFTTRRSAGGHGLGLSTAFGIARQSGGDLRVDSVPAVGTTFTLLLPLLAAGADEDAPPPRSTVLFAEDDPDLRPQLAAVLEEQGHTVLAAADGAAALALVADEPTGPDLLVTDIDMPAMDGLLLAAALRERWPQMPALFLSGARPSAELPGQFLGKPFSHDELRRTVSALLRNASA